MKIDPRSPPAESLLRLRAAVPGTPSSFTGASSHAVVLLVGAGMITRSSAICEASNWAAAQDRYNRIVSSMSSSLALVLSGGGLFGAWQAGAWAALEGTIVPDLVVGTSVGALNGAVIASGAPAAHLRQLWLDPSLAKLGALTLNVSRMASNYQPRIPFVVTVTRLWDFHPEVVLPGDLRWQHVAASCAIPGAMAPIRIAGRLYCDGGVRNSLPIWAAVKMGARRILALHAVPVFPSRWLRPAVTVFRKIALFDPPAPTDVEVLVLRPSEIPGSVREMFHWDRERIERWLDRGLADGADWVAARSSLTPPQSSR